MRRLLFFIILSLSLNSFGQEVTKTEAKTAALNFLNAIEQQEYIVDSVFLIKHNNTPIYYIINFCNDAFLMLSADKSARAVLGFSLKSKYDFTNIPPNASEFFDIYKSQIYYLKSNNIISNSQIAENWDNLLQSNIDFSASKSVSPLLTSAWGQGCYYNSQCPVDPASSSCGHVVTGCVATAMGQVINYHKFPPNGSGIHSYNSNYGLLTADFGSTNYDWQNMSDTLNQNSDSNEVFAVAQLLSNCGISVDMMYSASASGAYSQDAANALVHYFNYSQDIDHIHKSNYVDSIWNNIIRTQLDSLQPMYYSGSGSGGHAFVCDGYIADDYFHINWGWNSILDGYFYLNALNPGSMNFSNYQSAIINIKPQLPSVCQGVTDTIRNHSGNISDGSSYADYQPAMNCSWLIQPMGINNLEIEFFNFDLESGDSLFVYDDSTSTNLIASYHINNQPNSIISTTSNSAFIQFISDNSNESSGWAANYKSNYCTVYNSTGKTTDTISDGSGDSLNYINNTNCYWFISDSLGRTINLEFIEFQTEAAYDFVEVYDGNSTNATLLGSFSGNSLPPTLTAYSGDMLINFISDGGVVDKGWKAVYYVCDNSKFIIANNDTVFTCDNEYFSFNNPLYTDLDWYFNDNYISTSDSLLVNNSGEYYAVKSNLNCPDDTSYKVFLSVNQSPNPNLPANAIVCYGSSLLLSADSIFQSYLWSTGHTTSSIIVDTSGMQNSQKIIFLSVTDSNMCTGIDSTIIVFKPCLNIKNKVNFPELDIFPNPSTDFFIVRFENEFSTVKAQLISNLGEIIMTKEQENSNILEFNIKHLPAAVYYLRVEIEEELKYFKIIIN